MSRGYRSCEVTLEFGDGEYLFRLPLKMIAELQEKCGAGIGTIYKRVILGDYYAVDLVETVRCGLVGGGVAGPDARKLIDRYCDLWPLTVWHQHAYAILSACMQGYEDGDERKKKAVKVTSRSRSRTPTATAQL